LWDKKHFKAENTSYETYIRKKIGEQGEREGNVHWLHAYLHTNSLGAALYADSSEAVV